MARWPDNFSGAIWTLILIFGLFPALAVAAYWFVRG
jgi:nitrate reductase NapE component